MKGHSWKPPPKTVQDYIISLARLGGNLARSNDGPPGIEVTWRGLIGSLIAYSYLPLSVE